MASQRPLQNKCGSCDLQLASVNSQSLHDRSKGVAGMGRGFLDNSSQQNKKKPPAKPKVELSGSGYGQCRSLGVNSPEQSMKSAPADPRWLLSCKFDEERKNSHVAKIIEQLLGVDIVNNPNRHAKTCCTIVGNNWDENYNKGSNSEKYLRCWHPDAPDHLRCTQPVRSGQDPTLDTCWKSSYFWRLSKSRKMLRVVEWDMLGEGQEIEKKMAEFFESSGGCQVRVVHMPNDHALREHEDLPAKKKAWCIAALALSKRLENIGFTVKADQLKALTEPIKQKCESIGLIDMWNLFRESVEDGPFYFEQNEQYLFEHLDVFAYLLSRFNTGSHRTRTLLALLQKKVLPEIPKDLEDFVNHWQLPPVLEDLSVEVEQCAHPDPWYPPLTKFRLPGGEVGDVGPWQHLAPFRRFVHDVFDHPPAAQLFYEKAVDAVKHLPVDEQFGQAIEIGLDQYPDKFLENRVLKVLQAAGVPVIKALESLEHEIEGGEGCAENEGVRTSSRSVSRSSLSELKREHKSHEVTSHPLDLQSHVRVFSRTASQWLDAKVVGFPSKDMIRVEYEVNNCVFGKSLHLQSGHLSFDSELEEHDPEFGIIAGCVVGGIALATAAAYKHDKDDSD